MESGNRALSQIYQRLAGARSSLLITDYDGTLAPFVTDRFKAVPYPGVMPRLRRLKDAGVETVFVTGRGLDEFQRLLPEAAGFEVWGSHGWERLTRSADKILHQPAQSVRCALTQAAQWAQERSLADRVDVKRGAVAMHYRGLSAQAVEELDLIVTRAWSKWAQTKECRLRRFNGGVELVATDWDKGRAVRAVCAEMRTDCTIYLGDDTTDEDAFTAVQPYGIGVLVSEEPRSSAARLHLKPPEELLRLLDSWVELMRLSR